VRQCSSSWSATTGKVDRSIFWSIDRNFNRSLLESINRFFAEKKNATEMQKNKSKTKLKSKYAQDSKKLSESSVWSQQKNSAAQNKNSIDLILCRSIEIIGQKVDRSIFLQKQNSAENR
jgi:hypothetical protein